MANLLDSLKEFATPELLGQAAQALGEHENGISKAVGGLVPTILAGLINKSGDSSAMAGIFNQLSNFDPGILDKLGSLIGGGNLAHNDPKDAAGNLLSALFGAKVPAITNAIASFAGIKSSSTSSLLGLAAPMVMGFLSKKINSEGLNVSGLINLLGGQKNSILGALPAGIGSVLGLVGLGGSGSSASADVASVEKPSGGMAWLWPLLLLLGLGGGMMYYLRNCSSKPETAKVEAPAPAPAPVAEAPKPKVELPAGTQEAAMQAFIMSADTISKALWFNFPEIMFDVNKATLKPESEAKLDNILALLNAYPAVKLKVGGYTDSDGDDKKNLKLSDERAKACVAWLTGKGIAAERLDGEGYGETNPVAPNDTPENKAKNRRISFSVRVK